MQNTPYYMPTFKKSTVDQRFSPTIEIESAGFPTLY